MSDFSDIMIDQTEAGTGSITARKRARNNLRKANKHENTSEITLVGDPRLVAGVTVNLKNFGAFDGKYIIEKAKHQVGKEYTVEVELRKCLEGY
jgi:phage protein D